MKPSKTELSFDELKKLLEDVDEGATVDAVGTAFRVMCGIPDYAQDKLLPTLAVSMATMLREFLDGGGEVHFVSGGALPGQVLSICCADSDPKAEDPASKQEP